MRSVLEEPRGERADGRRQRREHDVEIPGQWNLRCGGAPRPLKMSKEGVSHDQREEVLLVSVPAIGHV